jgi:hypothetical protein
VAVESQKQFNLPLRLPLLRLLSRLLRLLLLKRLDLLRLLPLGLRPPPRLPQLLLLLWLNLPLNRLLDSPLR